MDNLKAVYFNSSGRMARMPYFLYALLLAVLMIVVGTVLVMILGLVGLLVAYLIFVYSFFCLMAKRLQDFDKPGKWAWGIIAVGLLGSVLGLSESTAQLGQLVSLLQLILGLIILFFPGTPGSNQYGPAPGSTGA